MKGWQIYAQKSRKLIKAEEFLKAQLTVEQGLKKFINHIELLKIGCDVSRALCHFDQSLEYSERLLSYHSANCIGYIKSAEDLISLNRFIDALIRIQEGLDKFPHNQYLYRIGVKTCFELKNFEMGLELADLAIIRFPESCFGYLNACKVLIKLKMFEEALERINKGLEVIPNNALLIKVLGQLNFLLLKGGGRSISLQNPFLLSNIDLKSIGFPTYKFLSSSIQQARTSVVSNLRDIQPYMENCTSLLIFENSILTKLPGLHNYSGTPFNHSVLVRGELEGLPDFPKGFYAHIKPIDLKQIPSQDVGFYLPFLRFDHFGHYLTETASSLSYLLFLRDAGISIPHSIPIIISGNYDQSRLAKILGVDSENITLISKKELKSELAFKYIISSTPTIINRRFTSIKHHEAVKLLLKYDLDISNNRLCTLSNIHDKVYISRSRLKSSYRLLKGEELLENYLVERGWFVLHPQEYTVIDQLSIYQNAKYICSQFGSAIHLLFGIETYNLRKFILLSRQSEDNYLRQFAAQNIPYYDIQCLITDPSSKKTGPNDRDLVLKRDFSYRDLAIQIDSESIV